MLTKSGTNKFHGSLYEFVRNEAFNANDYASVVARPLYRRNQFGGSIGGPIIKDRTFFFGTYSGLRQNTSRFLNNAIVPTDLERLGNFSQSGTRPRDPSTGTTLATATLFANGIIPTARLDPVAVKILNDYIPKANLAGNRWQGNIPLPYNTNEYLIKIDHQLNEPHRLSFTYFNTSGSQTVFPGNGNLPWATQNFKWTAT
ncbi:MAG: hypothetical protein HC846_12820 [Blastocatellia bacterium]|nr:hypothetical protein [Blastocatellia bacterium]